MTTAISSFGKAGILRVPEVTLVFWIIKTLSTTVGETGADFLSFDLGWGMPLTTVLMAGFMALGLYLQFFRFKRYVVASYWSLVVLMSVIGTLVTDMLVDLAGVSLISLSIAFTVMMLAGFYVWYRNEGTLSIHSIDTGKREFYYWVVILLAFALGTGVGDLISEQLALGYDAALLLFAGLIGLVAVAYYALNLNAVTAFWIAYVLTRPLGASLGDFMIQAPSDGGLGISMATINMIFCTAILAFAGYEWLRIRRTAMAAGN
ncbi:hypothetical protein [Pseudodesulfovibrio sp.]|uniref:COG4705 family protein n=1 Tax=unclassified Pseudodesulfovibrio TaxID=2661612 RepID=UPI003AFFC8A6